MPSFGKILKTARKKKNLKSGEVAKKLGMSQSTYSKYEHDEMKGIPIGLVKKICICLEIDANTLFLDTEEFEFDYPKKNVSYSEISIKEIIEKFKTCIGQTMEIPELVNESEKVTITDSKICFNMRYHFQPEYDLEKLNPYGLCCMIFIFSSKMLDKINEVCDTIPGGMDGNLARAYASYTNLILYIISE